MLYINDFNVYTIVYVLGKRASSVCCHAQSERRPKISILLGLRRLSVSSCSSFLDWRRASNLACFTHCCNCHHQYQWLQKVSAISTEQKRSWTSIARNAKSTFQGSKPANSEPNVSTILLMRIKWYWPKTEELKKSIYIETKY